MGHGPNKIAVHRELWNVDESVFQALLGTYPIWKVKGTQRADVEQAEGWMWPASSGIRMSLERLQDAGQVWAVRQSDTSRTLRIQQAPADLVMGHLKKHSTFSTQTYSDSIKVMKRFHRDGSHTVSCSAEHTVGLCLGEVGVATCGADGVMGLFSAPGESQLTHHTHWSSQRLFSLTRRYWKCIFRQIPESWWWLCGFCPWHVS